MALNERTKASLAGVESGHLQEVAEFVDQDALVEGIEPGLNLGEELGIGIFGQGALSGGRRISTESCLAMAR